MLRRFDTTSILSGGPFGFTDSCAVFVYFCTGCEIRAEDNDTAASSWLIPPQPTPSHDGDDASEYASSESDIKPSRITTVGEISEPRVHVYGLRNHWELTSNHWFRGITTFRLYSIGQRKGQV
ncbi:hypothetical protein HDV63DRAFT_78937 [Trichoderma sp. SZMC 28014]